MLIEAIIFCILVYLIYKIDKKPDGLPPGPWGVPVLGSLSFNGTDSFTAAAIKELRAKHGDVFCIRLGSQVIVYLTDFDIIKTAFNQPELQSRPNFYSLLHFNFFKNIGLLLSYGNVWSTGRRFALRHLRDLGLGKTRLQESIQYEARVLVEHLEKLVGKPTGLTLEVNVAVLNVIWQLVAGKHYELDDVDMLRFQAMQNQTLLLMQGSLIFLDLFPWLDTVLPMVVKNKWMKLDVLTDIRKEFYSFFEDVVKEHLETLDSANPRDYIDQYLLEMEKEKDNPDTTFTSDYMDLYAAIGDMFAAGSETTSSTLRWMVLLMAKYPEEQKKAQKLIDEVVGDRQPALEDKENLVYLEAVVFEVMRFSSLVPQSIGHAASCDTTIAGYKIPKDTVIMACTELCHHDPAHWERPDDFYPPHFIDADGKLLTKKDGFAPFSLGRRQCLGESMARAELFLFTAAILQRFNISPAPGDPMDTTVDRTKFLFNMTKPFEVVLTLRNKN